MVIKIYKDKKNNFFEKKFKISFLKNGQKKTCPFLKYG